MRKLDILEVVKAGNAFKIQVVTPEGEVLMAGKKTYARTWKYDYVREAKGQAPERHGDPRLQGRRLRA